MYTSNVKLKSVRKKNKMSADQEIYMLTPDIPILRSGNIREFLDIKNDFWQSVKIFAVIEKGEYFIVSRQTRIETDDRYIQWNKSQIEVEVFSKSTQKIEFFPKTNGGSKTTSLYSIIPEKVFLGVVIGVMREKTSIRS